MYDYIFITNLPAFYKINLYNELAKRLKIYVVFIADSSYTRTRDFTSGELNFDHHIIYSGKIENRPRPATIFGLLKILRDKKYIKLVVGGWDEPEYWISLAVSPAAKNCLAIESSCYESCTSGFRALIKRMFLKKISLAFPSGESQLEVLKQLGFSGRQIMTRGVGIINKPERRKALKPFQNKYLYVGRLSKEKNLATLISAFNQLPGKYLTIVGSGPREKELKDLAKNNIAFISHVQNDKMAVIYQSHDVFILPSTSEPWGLVVEEALYHGLPVLASDKCGCADTLIKGKGTGLLFDPYSRESLVAASEQMSKQEVFSRIKDTVMRFNINKKDEEQLESYVKGLK